MGARGSDGARGAGTVTVLASLFAPLRLKRSVLVFALAAGLGLSAGYADGAAQITKRLVFDVETAAAS